MLSPNYPMNYDNNHECIYSIQVINLIVLQGFLLKKQVIETQYCALGLM